MILEGYTGFGGDYFESAALAHLLAYRGVSLDGRPIDEAFCFGASGGIAAGYSFCPAIPGFNLGPGTALVGRYGAHLTGPDLVLIFFSRLGFEVEISETPDEREAADNLRAFIGKGTPALVWGTPPDWSLLAWPETLGTYRFVVCGLDETSADCAGPYPTPVTMDGGELAACRSRVFNVKNRIARLSAGQNDTLTRDDLRRAAGEGLLDAVGDYERPPTGIKELDSLEGFARKLEDGIKHKKRWAERMSPDMVFRMLRDMFTSIEGTSRTGGLLRPLYAKFLWEAARLFGSQEIAGAAEYYEDLGRRWSRLADALLPDGIAVCAKAKAAILRRRTLWSSPGGEKAAPRYLEETSAIEASVLERPPFTPGEAEGILEQVREELVDMAEGERIGRQELASTLPGLKVARF